MAIKTEDASKSESDGNEQSGDEKLLAEALAFFKDSAEATASERMEALDDLEFVEGKQWPDAIKAERDRDLRPCLVINRLPQFVQQVTNDQRQNRPALKAHPVDSKGDPETAKIIQGLMRHIEYNSGADAAYDTAFEGAVKGGFGYWRVVTDYASPTSFDQEILIKRIRNQFSVYFDPHSQSPDGSDANKAGIVEDISKAEYESQYPDSALAQKDIWDDTGNSAPDWVNGDSCRIAEYFYKEWKPVDLVLLSDGKSMPKSELPAYAESIQAQLQPGEPLPMISIVSERKSLVPVIKWCKLNGAEILEKKEWPGKYIPIVPVYGLESYINGVRKLSGIVRNAKDPQRMLNYWKSAETEAIALAPRAPFIMAEGQDKGFEQDWASANRRNHSSLKYNPMSVNGQLVGPPQRQGFEPAVQAITQAAMFAADDLKATTGIYDAALGAKSNETSGVAIQRRNIQAQTSNFHFVDNLTRSLKHTGRILIDLIPHIYDGARAARIIGEDGEEKVVRINEPFVPEGEQKPVIYAMDVGQYDITVDVGPSFASKRQEAASAMLEMTKANPALMQIAGDLIVKSMDFPNSSDLAERIKKSMPPELTDDGKKQEIPPQIQAQMQQQNQLIEQLTKAANESAEVLRTKRMEIESKERIEMKKLEVQVEIKRAELGAQDSRALLDAELAQINAQQARIPNSAPVEPDMDDDFSGSPDLTGTNGAFEQPPAQDPTGGESPGLPPQGEF